VVFEDEAAAMLCPPIRGTWAPCGVVPILRYCGARGRKTSMAAFVCYRRGRLPRLFYALIEDGSFTEQEFGPLLEELHAALGARRVILVWDRLSGHVRSLKTRAFLAANANWLSVEPLPGYAPELDPVEQCWAWIKNGPLANYCATTLAEMTDAAARALERLRQRPELLTPFLRHAGLDWT
jgi:putative transposase